MSDRHGHAGRLSRRALLRAMGGGGAALSLGGLLTAEGYASPAPPPQKLSGPVSFWSRETWLSGAMEPVLKARLAEFDKQYGTQSNVEFMTLAISSQKEQAALATGSPPDLAQQGQDLATAFGSAGHLVPLDDVFRSLKGEMLPLQPVAYVSWKGTTYAIPWWLETRVIYYHTDLLNRAGVKPPTTWDELMEAGRALTTKDQFGLVCAGNDVGIGQIFIPWATMLGGWLTGPDNQITTRPEPFDEVLNYLGSLYDKGVFPKATPTYGLNDTEQLFVLKKAAMIYRNGQILATIKRDRPELMDTVGAVALPVQRKGQTSRCFLGGFTLFVFAKGKNPQAGKELLKFLFEPAWYTNYLAQSQGFELPVLKATAAQPFYQERLIKPLVEAAKTAVRYNGTAAVRPWMGPAEAQLVFAKPVVDVWTRKNSVRGAVGELLAKCRALAGQYGA